MLEETTFKVKSLTLANSITPSYLGRAGRDYPLDIALGYTA
jgi:hypothetical protein